MPPAPSVVGLAIISVDRPLCRVTQMETGVQVSQIAMVSINLFGLLKIVGLFIL